jgi:hypothetical protein
MAARVEASVVRGALGVPALLAIMIAALGRSLGVAP